MFVDLVDLEDVLKAVQARGPIIPMDIRKFLGKGDSITIGAALSSLLSKNLIKFTNVKMGSSPFYYVKGQENRLELLNKYLNEKDKRTFEELRQAIVLKDNVQEPLIRVSLRNIPDFAKKLELTNNGETVLYWRWYATSEDDAINMIRGNYQKRDISGHMQEQQVQNINQNNQQVDNVHQSNNVHQGNNIKHDIQQNNDVQQDHLNQQRVHQQNINQNNNNQNNQHTSNTNQNNNTNNNNNNLNTTANHNNFNNQIDKKQNTKITESRRDLKQKSVEEQKTFEDVVPDFDDVFFKQIKKFFDKNVVALKKATLIRKGSEYDFIISMKTPFGETEYFCKAKSKKKCNEGDLSSAYLQGQNKRLPTIFLTTGEITKKAKLKASDEYKGLMIKEL